MIFCRYFMYFIAFSAIGWFFETCWSTHHTGHWENRGFLMGPICPIYGVGAVSIWIFDAACDLSGSWIGAGKLFLAGFLGSIVMEWTTAIILEKLFRASWWDYSDMPLNIKGRICLPASVGFGAAGLVIIYVILPVLRLLLENLPPLFIEASGMICLALFAVDCTLAVAALTNFKDTIDKVESAINRRMEIVVDRFNGKLSESDADAVIQYHIESVMRGKDMIYRGALRRVIRFLPETPSKMRALKSIISVIGKLIRPESPGTTVNRAMSRISDSETPEQNSTSTQSSTK